MIRPAMIGRAMIGRAWTRAVAVAMAIGAAACGSSPEPVYYALAFDPGAPQRAALSIVKLRRPGLPGYLDRSDVVTGVADYRVRMSAVEQWGSPLDEMIGRVLADDLTQRLPGTLVFTEAGPLSADPDATVEIDIQRFDVGAGGALTLRVGVAVEHGRSHAAVAAQTFELTAGPAEGNARWLAGAMSHLLGALADRIAGMLARGPS